MREVVRGQCFALHDREVQLDLVQPGRVHGQVNQPALGHRSCIRVIEVLPACEEPLSTIQ